MSKADASRLTAVKIEPSCGLSDSKNRVPGHSVFMLLNPTLAARACLVDHELAASDVGPVEGLDCVVCGRIGHFDESKASGPSGLAISDHTRRIDRAMRLEHLAEIVVGCCVRQVAYEQIHSVFLYSGRDADPCGYPRDPKSRFERIVQPETSVSSEAGRQREIPWFRCVSSARPEWCLRVWLVDGFRLVGIGGGFVR